MRIVEKKALSLEEKVILIELWNNEYPMRLHLKTIDDFEIYLNELLNVNHYLLLDSFNKIMGWAFTFVRDDEDWFAII
ncbi:hypothetical protein DBR27_20000, partial [Flavobacterium sp. HMWF030]